MERVAVWSRVSESEKEGVSVILRVRDLDRSSDEDCVNDGLSVGDRLTDNSWEGEYDLLCGAVTDTDAELDLDCGIEIESEMETLRDADCSRENDSVRDVDLDLLCS